MLSPDITPHEQKKRGKENTDKVCFARQLWYSFFPPRKKKRRRKTTITKINAVKGQYRSIIAKEVT